MAKAPDRRAVAYLRISGGGDQEEGHSLEDQPDYIDELAEQYELEIVETFSDTASAWKANSQRQGFENMKVYCNRHGIKHIVAWIFSRLVRMDSPTERATFQNWLSSNKIAIYTTDKEVLDIGNNPRHVEKFEAAATEAAAYSRNISLNNTRQWKVHQKRGRYRTGVTPFGYKREYRDNPEPSKRSKRRQYCHFVPHEIDSPFAIEIFDRVAASETCAAIAADFTKRKVINNRGTGKECNRWQSSVVKQIVLNPVYIGAMRTKAGAIVPTDRVDPIIDESVWHTCNRLLTKEYVKLKRNRRSPMNPLSGLLYCAKCGAAYVISTSLRAKDPDTGKRSGDLVVTELDGQPFAVHRWHACGIGRQTGYIDGRCSPKSIREDKVLEVLMALAPTLFYGELVKQAEETRKESATGKVAELANKEQERKRLVKALASGLIDESEFEELAPSLEELQAIQQQVDAASQQIGNLSPEQVLSLFTVPNHGHLKRLLHQTLNRIVCEDGEVVAIETRLGLEVAVNSLGVRIS